MEGPIGSEGPNSCTLSALWGLSGQNRESDEVSVFWGHLGTLLGPFWGRLGAVLGQLGAILGREMDVRGA